MAYNKYNDNVLRCFPRPHDAFEPAHRMKKIDYLLWFVPKRSVWSVLIVVRCVFLCISLLGLVQTLGKSEAMTVTMTKRKKYQKHHSMFFTHKVNSLCPSHCRQCWVIFIMQVNGADCDNVVVYRPTSSSQPSSSMLFGCCAAFIHHFQCFGNWLGMLHERREFSSFFSFFNQNEIRSFTLHFANE